MTLKGLGYRTAHALCQALPLGTSMWCAERLGDLQWRRARPGRQAVSANLSILMGSTVAETSPLVRGVFRNFSRYIAEFFTVHRVAHVQPALEGYEHFLQARRAGRGVITLTAHLGNWELGAVFIRRMGFPVSGVALPHDDPQMDRLFNAQRQRCGVGVIPVGREAVRTSLQRLRRGEILGMLGDWEFFDNGEAVSLSGHLASLPRGPAVLSLRSRAPIVPTFLTRDGWWKFRLSFEPPLWPGSGGRTGKAVTQMVQAYAQTLERYLRRFSDQWLMFQPMMGVESPRSQIRRSPSRREERVPCQ